MENIVKFCPHCNKVNKPYFIYGYFCTECHMNRQQYPIITLCGSTKFKEEFLEAQKELTLQGYIVISVGLFGHADGDYQTVLTEEVKTILDDMHKKKIDMSHGIFVINKYNYIGNSTRSEIEYAESKGKFVLYMEE